jgi:hypothetical protein
MWLAAVFNVTVKVYFVIINVKMNVGADRYLEHMFCNFFI